MSTVGTRGVYSKYTSSTKQVALMSHHTHRLHHKSAWPHILNGQQVRSSINTFQVIILISVISKPFPFSRWSSHFIIYPLPPLFNKVQYHPTPSLTTPSDPLVSSATFIQLHRHGQLSAKHSAQFHFLAPIFPPIGK